MRLIDADALMNKINTSVFTADTTTTMAVNMACRWIENAPTIEPEIIACGEGELNAQPDWNEMLVICDNCGHVITVTKGDAQPERKKGKWIYDPEPYPMGGAFGHYECSLCGEWVRGGETNFCPNCGADMREPE